MKNKKKNKKLTVVLIFAGCVLLLALLGILAYGYYHDKVSMMQYDDGKISEGGTVTEEEAREDNEDMKRATEELEEKQAVIAEGDIFGDSNVFNVLLIGTDERTKEFSENARGDSCILLSVNKETMVIHLVSLERGMGVPILEGQYEGQWDWLTHTFRYGGADLMMREVQECLRIEVNHYVRANFNTFEQMIDAVGGVDIELTPLEVRGLNGEVWTNAKTHTRVYEGVNHLDGYDALQYSRLRYIDSDWQRIRRQRNVLQTVISQTKELSLPELNSLLNTVLPLVQTNLTESEISSLLLSLAPKAYKITVEQMTIPEEGTYGSMTGMGGRTLFAVDFDANARILREALYNDENQEAEP